MRHADHPPASIARLPEGIEACLFDMDRRHGADVVVTDLADLLAPA